MPRFVIQQHDTQKTGRHFDFRIEHDGVLESWVVQKAKIPSSEEKVLAVQVEPYPMWYANFTGEMPEGRYSIGKVSHYDSGQCQIEEWSPDSIFFTLAGKHARGDFTLIRMQGNRWLWMSTEGFEKESSLKREGQNVTVYHGTKSPEMAALFLEQGMGVPIGNVATLPIWVTPDFLLASLYTGTDGVVLELSVPRQLLKVDYASMYEGSAINAYYLTWEVPAENILNVYSPTGESVSLEGVRPYSGDLPLSAEIYSEYVGEAALSLIDRSVGELQNNLAYAAESLNRAIAQWLQAGDIDALAYARSSIEELPASVREQEAVQDLLGSLENAIQMMLESPSAGSQFASRKSLVGAVEQQLDEVWQYNITPTEIVLYSTMGEIEVPYRVEDETLVLTAPTVSGYGEEEALQYAVNALVQQFGVVDVETVDELPTPPVDSEVDSDLNYFNIVEPSRLRGTETGIDALGSIQKEALYPYHIDASINEIGDVEGRVTMEGSSALLKFFVYLDSGVLEIDYFGFPEEQTGERVPSSRSDVSALLSLLSALEEIVSRFEVQEVASTTWVFEEHPALAARLSNQLGVPVSWTHIDEEHLHTSRVEPESEVELFPEQQLQETEIVQSSLQKGATVFPISLMRLHTISDPNDLTSKIPADDLLVSKKYDGWLTQVVKEDDVRLYSRHGKDKIENFPELVPELDWLPKGSFLLGELVWWDEDGEQSLSKIQSVAGSSTEEAARKREQLDGYYTFEVFDLLFYNGDDLRDSPFSDRRELLEQIFKGSSHVNLVEEFPFVEWESLIEAAVAEGGEGVVFKNVTAPYVSLPLGEDEPRPAGFWYKFKGGKGKNATDDFVVTEFSLGKEESLLMHLHQYGSDGLLYFVGKLDNLSAGNTSAALNLLERGPFVVEVGFQERTRDGKLRHPSFVRFRPDKPAASATFDEERWLQTLKKVGQSEDALEQFLSAYQLVIESFRDYGMPSEEAIGLVIEELGLKNITLEVEAEARIVEFVIGVYEGESEGVENVT